MSMDSEGIDLEMKKKVLLVHSSSPVGFACKLQCYYVTQ